MYFCPLLYLCSVLQQEWGLGELYHHWCSATATLQYHYTGVLWHYRSLVHAVTGWHCGCSLKSIPSAQAWPSPLRYVTHVSVCLKLRSRYSPLVPESLLSWYLCALGAFGAVSNSVQEGKLQHSYYFDLTRIQIQLMFITLGGASSPLVSMITGPP